MIILLICDLSCDLNYSGAPEIETAGLFQSHAGLNLSQFQTDCLLCINSSTAMLNYLTLFESILGIVTPLTNEIYQNFDVTFDLHKLLCHALIIFFCR